MKLNGLILALACAAPAVAFAGSAPSRASLDDQALALAHLANTGEIQDSNLALSKATDKAVLSYANMLLTDHTQAEQKVQALAGDHYADLDGVISTDQFLMNLKQTHDQQVQQLSQLSGLDFERQFLTNERDDHALVIQRFETLTANMTATDPVFQFYQSVKSTLEQHESEAAQLLQQLGR